MKPSESKLVTAVKWTACTKGCQYLPALIAFDDIKKFEKCAEPNCDNCYVILLRENNALEHPPVEHGIPFSITLAYEPYAHPCPAAPSNSRKTRMRTLTVDRKIQLTADIQAW